MGTSADAPTRHSLSVVVLAAVGLDLLGAWVARRRGLVGEPLLITLPASVPTGLVLLGWGTALSGPLLVDGALGALSLSSDELSPRQRRCVAALGCVRLAGVLAEPLTWGRRAPRWAMLVSGGHLAVAVSLLRRSRV